MSIPLVDIVDRNNQPLGFTADVNEATRRGLWYRGIHIVLYTRDGYVLVERRAHRIVFYPDHLDISLGGVVDSGEQPHEAAQRELEEEIGLHVTPDQLELVSVNRYNHRWPSYHKITRNIVYHYLVEIPSTHIPIQLQLAEVAEARFLTLREAQRLVRRRRLPGFGLLGGKYAMYHYLLGQVSDRLRSAN